jgi:hypothetical protein
MYFIVASTYDPPIYLSSICQYILIMRTSMPKSLRILLHGELSGVDLMHCV